MRTVGFTSIKMDLRGFKDSWMVKHTRERTNVFALITFDMSTGGMLTMQMPEGTSGDWKNWVWAAEASVVMTRKLTRMSWFVTRRLANWKSGIICPIPGLGSKAMCGLTSLETTIVITSS